MASPSTRWWGRLERATPTLFLLAGLALVVLLTLGLVVRSTTVSIARTTFWPLFPLAVALALVGLLGLGPRLARRARRPTLLGGGIGVVGTALLVGGLGALLAVSPPGPYPGNLGLLGAPFFLGLLAFVPAVAIFGVVCLRTGVPSRRIGALLLLVGLLQGTELVGAVALFSSAGTAAPSTSYLLFETVVYGLIAAALVVVGVSLRRHVGQTPAESPVNAHDARVDTS